MSHSPFDPDQQPFLARPGLLAVVLALLVIGICWAMLMQMR